MANKKLTIRQQAKLLVQNILAKNTLSANEILKQLISQAEQLRQKNIRKLILQQDEQDDLGDESLDDEGGDDLDEGGDQESADDEGGDDESDQSMSNAQVQQIVDDSLAIQCEINAKRITVLFDTIAELKKALENKELDPNSKEYIKFDITISYYSDKLQEFQGKTNPGVDQSKLEEAIDKITEALEQLKGQLGIENSDVDSDVDTPEQVSGDQPEQSDQSEQDDLDQEQSDQEQTAQEQSDQESKESDELDEQLE